MKVRDEIETHSEEKDKPILKWLFDKYHMESQWRFVAHCKFQRYGTHSYQTHRIWYPTQEGKVLYYYWNDLHES